MTNRTHSYKENINYLKRERFTHINGTPAFRSNAIFFPMGFNPLKNGINAAIGAILKIPNLQKLLHILQRVKTHWNNLHILNKCGLASLDLLPNKFKILKLNHSMHIQFHNSFFPPHNYPNQ